MKNLILVLTAITSLPLLAGSISFRNFTTAAIDAADNGCLNVLGDSGAICLGLVDAGDGICLLTTGKAREVCKGAVQGELGICLGTKKGTEKSVCEGTRAALHAGFCFGLSDSSKKVCSAIQTAKLFE